MGGALRRGSARFGAKRPPRHIHAVITIFYGFTSWVAVGTVGEDRLREVAGKELGELFFRLSTQYVHPLLTEAMMVMLVTSLFASLLALHNAASRYMYALGRERILPSALGKAHVRHQAPSRVSQVQSAASLVVGAFAAAGADPFLNLANTMLGLGTIGVMALQATASFAVAGFFLRRPDRHWWRTTLAPLLGGLGLLTATVLVVVNYPTLTGSTSPLINGLPCLLPLLGGEGAAYAGWLRRPGATPWPVRGRPVASGAPFLAVGRPWFGHGHPRRDVLDCHAYATISAFTVVERVIRMPLSRERGGCDWAKLFGGGGELGVAPFAAGTTVGQIASHVTDAQGDDRNCDWCAGGKPRPRAGGGGPAVAGLGTVSVGQADPERVPHLAKREYEADRARAHRKSRIEPIQRAVRELFGATAREIECAFCQSTGHRGRGGGAAAVLGDPRLGSVGRLS
ncbi:APC family permease [Amycolatopsis sp. VS8301801F10]|uniref:APC family permease n=1 Tax=Amycolatopsis sp. VS8301801F10 TaxID=2652442 RepID=UPI0038FC9473